MDTDRAKEGPRASAALAGTRFADVRWVPETDSTNTDALEALREGATDVVVVADHQRAGRGRLDRRWESPPGASVLMTIGTSAVPGDGEPRHHLMLTAVALAAVEACGEVAGLRPGLKWPNDLVAVGAGGAGVDLKLAGVLAEAHPLDGGRVATVIGVGINCNWGPPQGGGIPEDLADIATSLDLLTGRPVDRVALVVSLVGHAADLLGALEGPDGVSSIVGAARAESATIGRSVRVELPEATLVGTAVDLDDTGALVVEDGEGTAHRVLAGDVIHLRPS